MSSRKARFLTSLGLLSLAIGTGLRLWAHGNYSHFASGFLLGLAVVFLIAGLVKKPQGIPE